MSAGNFRREHAFRRIEDMEPPRVDSCTEQMLEMEQTDAVYGVGRALRAVYAASGPEEDAAALLAIVARLDEAERGCEHGPR